MTGKVEGKTNYLTSKAIMHYHVEVEKRIDETGKSGKEDGGR